MQHGDSVGNVISRLPLYEGMQHDDSAVVTSSLFPLHVRMQHGGSGGVVINLLSMLSSVYFLRKYVCNIKWRPLLGLPTVYFRLMFVAAVMCYQC